MNGVGSLESAGRTGVDESGSRALLGKAFAITGGSRGIGLACARSVLEAGGSVGIQARRREVLERAAHDLSSVSPEGEAAVVAVSGDAAVPEDARRLVDAVVERHGRLDGLVVGAGTQRPVDILTSSADDWRGALDGNLLPAVVGCQAAVPHLESGGSIVFLGSVAALRGSDVSIPYAVAKAGLSLIAKQLAAKLGRQGIRVNCVVAGSVATDMLDRAYEDAAAAGNDSAESMHARAAAGTALGRVAEPVELARIVAFLLSPAASFVTGVDIVADGGHMATLGKAIAAEEG
jgi:NAD(P)-dependent dehydrogenase (short-subunit alcohol dehydrogenase family)